ncbi:hypothetical protein CRUP_037517, partial [Coryphaenoides rupestris]
MIGSPRGGGGASAGAGEGCCRRDPPVGAKATGATAHPNCSAPLSLPICRPENGFTEKRELKANELNTDLYAYCESSPAEPPVQTPSSSSSSSSSPSSSSPLSSSSSTTSFPSSSSDDDPRSLEECLSILADPQRGAGHLSDPEVLRLVTSRHILAYKLEAVLRDAERGVAVRRSALSAILPDPHALASLPFRDYDYST